MTLTAIDAFAGSGGLTVGLKCGGFRVVAAIELEPSALTTYRFNHPEVCCVKQDIATVSGSELLKQLKMDRIDLLAGCPPCQGFTGLTAKYRGEDPRNGLVLEIARLAEEIRPRAIMMENVPGLMIKGKPYYQRLCKHLEALGYLLTEGVLQVADFGVPQSRRRLVLLGGSGFSIPLPGKTHSRSGAMGLPPGAQSATPLAKCPDQSLCHRPRPGEESKDPTGMSSATCPRRTSKDYGLPGQARPGKISLKIFAQPATGGYRGFSNVYGRMEWDRPSPTITGGCTTFSKGRFGHPEADRTISVREAALLQTFPKDYRFETCYMDHACNMIGNALPCDFAEVISRRCAVNLRLHPDPYAIM
ncbi:MAG: DNA cytosine methyltransferase [Rhodobacteraceae bacterium]|nr:DNA cytosine methyltransferase [Paracoccaceae bacterium]